VAHAPGTAVARVPACLPTVTGGLGGACQFTF
jgi:hypothetical protein